jgi:hypothetical protein
MLVCYEFYLSSELYFQGSKVLGAMYRTTRIDL